MTTVLQSLNAALHQLMTDDERVVVIGEDILDPYGGAFRVTAGLSTKFPTRVVATPISEAAIVGTASGMALRGLRPIAELMFGDFTMLSGDQLVNHAAKFRWMYNDAVRVPLVVRTPMGGRRGYGPTHSQSLEKHFAGVPGLWVVAPHILASPGALLRQATLECDDPVLFVESKTCYAREVLDGVDGMSIDRIVDASAPFATVHARHNGREADAVLWCYGGMVPVCLDAVVQLRDREGLTVELAVPAQLSPIPSSHLARIVESTAASVFAYAEEASVQFGWTAEVLAQVQSMRDGAQHRRIGAAFSPIGSSRELERNALPQVADVITQILECF
jgi:pyruvate/2-oxoglutarate/acetoin dehydrogenase E1 component